MTWDGTYRVWDGNGWSTVPGDRELEEAIAALKHTMAEAARVIVQQRDLLAQIVEGKE